MRTVKFSGFSKAEVLAKAITAKWEEAEMLSHRVRCGRCHWKGTVGQLGLISTPNPLHPDDISPEPSCPACLSHHWLEFENNGK